MPLETIEIAGVYAGKRRGCGGLVGFPWSSERPSFVLAALGPHPCDDRADHVGPRCDAREPPADTFRCGLPVRVPRNGVDSWGAVHGMGAASWATMKFPTLSKVELDAVSGGASDAPAEDTSSTNDGRWCRAIGSFGTLLGAYHVSRKGHEGMDGYYPKGEELMTTAKDAGDALCDWWDGSEKE